MSNRLTRKELISILLEKMSLLTVANGYSCDVGLGATPFEKLSEKFERDVCTVVDGKETYSNAQKGLANALRELEVSMSFVLVGDDARERVYGLMEDVIAWLGANKSMGQRCLAIELVSMDLDTAETDDLTELVVELRCKY